MSYCRFRVVGNAPMQVDEQFLAQLAEHVVRPPSVGPPPEMQVGWCAGQHVFDETFDYPTIGYEGLACFAMRVDTNRVPAEVRRAYRAMAEREQAKASATTFLNRAEKVAARDETDDRCKRELAEGRHRSSSMVPIVWDFRRKLLFAAAFSDAKVSALSDLIATTFDCRLESLSAGALARELADQRGWLSQLADVHPTSFTPPPARAEGGDREPGDVDPARPITPWSHGPEPNDFLGNEWLIWLWYHSASPDSGIETSAGPVSIAIDRMLDMDCAWDATGKQMLRADGPAALPEARKALQTGKWPRKAGLLIAADDDDQQAWSCNMQGDRFIVSGIKVPKPQHRFSSPREETEHRLESMSRLDECLGVLYETFLAERLSSDRWPTTRRRISEWIRGRREVQPSYVGDAGDRPMVEIEVDPHRNEPEVSSTQVDELTAHIER